MLRPAPTLRPNALPDAIAYVAADVGLANRLRALAGYAAMSRCLLDRPVRLHWVRDRDCPAQFQELFAAADVELLSPAKAAALPPASIFTRADWFQQIWCDELQGLVPRPQFLAAVAQFLQSLRVRDEVARSVEVFSDRHDLETVIGLHIRHTDNLLDYDYFARTIPGFRMEHISQVEGFEDLIERSSDPRFFLATDNADVERRLVKRFGERIVRFGKRFRAAAGLMRRFAPAAVYRPSTMQDALAELLLLGRCEQVVGTYFSSFGELGAIWGLRDFSIMLGRSVELSGSAGEILTQLRLLAVEDDAVRQRSSASS
ncbi:MAG: hypothetical protein GC160_07135 [Acidobacteria bacterium]|nr:hypothetical protein [Acidobacteriota bacterium]